MTAGESHNMGTAHQLHGDSDGERRRANQTFSRTRGGELRTVSLDSSAERLLTTKRSLEKNVRS